MRIEFLSISVLGVASGPRVKLATFRKIYWERERERERQREVNNCMIERIIFLMPSRYSVQRRHGLLCKDYYVTIHRFSCKFTLAESNNCFMHLQTTNKSSP